MVVDMANRVVGIITRKDLMGFNLEERLVNRKLRGYSIEGGITKLLPSEYDEMKYDDIKEVWYLVYNIYSYIIYVCVCVYDIYAVMQYANMIILLVKSSVCVCVDVSN